MMFKRIIVAGVLALGWTAPAIAAPEISGPVVSADGFVTVELLLPDAPDAVRSSLENSARIMGHDPGATSHVIETSGPCELIAIEGLFMGATGKYTLRRCPTETGFSESLESTEFYSSYQAEWVVRPGDSGTVLQYRLKAEIGGLAPIVANYELGNKASKMMKKLGRDLSENGLD